MIELNQVWNCMNGEGESMLGLRVDFENSVFQGTTTDLAGCGRGVW